MARKAAMLKESSMTYLTLFASSGTLICCALPIILVSLGLGATVAALTSNFPLLVTIAEYKTWVFVGSGGLLLVSGWLMYRSRRTCPTEPELARLCQKTQTWNRPMPRNGSWTW